MGKRVKSRENEKKKDFFSPLLKKVGPCEIADKFVVLLHLPTKKNSQLNSWVIEFHSLSETMIRRGRF